MTNKFLVFIFSVLIFFAISGCDDSNSQSVDYLVTEGEFSVLVYTITAGWRHDSIEDGIQAVEQLGRDHNFAVTATENADYFTAENLSGYEVVLFLNTTETVFDDSHREIFKNYIQAGGGFAGVHSATDTEYDWPWYGELVGAYFDNHPGNPNVRDAVIDVVDANHPSTDHLPERWERADEWYNFGYINDNINVLLKLDTDSYQGSDHPGNHPVAWFHEYDGGRAFYTALGHTRESFSEPLFLEHLLGGIQYAAGVTD